MRNLKLISNLLLIFLLSACSKEKEKITFTGKILEFCNGAPLANTNLIIWQDSEYSLIKTPQQGPYSAKTDGDGNFSFEVEGGPQIQIRVGSRSILRDIPVRSDLSNLGTFYANPTTSFVYRIKVNNPYQLGDTLHLSVQEGINSIIIPAPLTDTTFLLVQNYGELDTQTFGNTTTLNVKGLAIVTKGQLNNQDIIKRDLFTFTLPVCPSKIDTLTIEIN